MNDLGFAIPPLPDAELPMHRKAVMRAVLLNEMAPVKRTRRKLVTGGIVVGVLAASAGAVVYHQVTAVTDTSSVQCYAVASFPASDSSYTTLAKAGIPGTVSIDNAIDACTALWRGGFFQLGTSTMITDQLQGRDYPIPALSDCVLPSGQNGVFPGGSGTCEKLRLKNVAVSVPG